MTHSYVCWAPSKVKPVSHLFYANTLEAPDSLDGSACGMSSLSVCGAPTVNSDPPDNACPDCKTIWRSWRGHTLDLKTYETPQERRERYLRQLAREHRGSGRTRADLEAQFIDKLSTMEP